ncbi:Transcriptional regulator, AraC family with amidase-like domain (fragment) [Shewanella benthica]|uniref:Transcriptional regulator, AraC family with amidase-like domain n=1 Tax=Shewanella benthica TaxID=43661 RepID=A0A330LW17_9GAMM
MFERNFPDVNLCMDKLVISDEHIHTAGATTSNLSLALHLIGILAGEQIANQMAKILLIDPNRTSQQPFMSMDLSVGVNNHKDELVTKIQNWMQTHIEQSFLLDEAKRLLETTELALEQIVDRVGYEDVSSFRKLFIQLTSLSPRAYRQKFNTHTCC